MAKISIVLPTFNRAHLISKSIESCLSQTFEDFELIVVNDNSSDNTTALVRQFQAKDSRVKLIVNERNLKLPGALNRGFAEATGEYFTWTSDDNIYKHNALETLYNELIKNHDSDLVYSNYTEIDENDKFIQNKRMNDVNDNFMNWIGCGSCFLYKKEVHIINKGYDIQLFLIEDYDFFMRAYLKFKFRYLDRYDLYCHRVHSTSLTNNHSHIVFEFQKIVVERNFEKLKVKFSKKETILFYRKYAVYYLLKNNFILGERYLRKLKSEDFKQYILTSCFIIVKKFINVFNATISVLKSLK